MTETIEFIYKLKLKDCEHVFAEGLEPGVLVTQGIAFEVDDNTSTTLLAKALCDEETEFINRYIEVEIEQVEETNGTGN